MRLTKPLYEGLLWFLEAVRDGSDMAKMEYEHDILNYMGSYNPVCDAFEIQEVLFDIAKVNNLIEFTILDTSQDFEDDKIPEGYIFWQLTKYGKAAIPGLQSKVKA